MIKKTNPKNRFKLGGNKFGGNPHLPKSTTWPKINNREATFVCQINLASLETDKLNLAFPKTGLLSFFVHSLFANSDNYGEDFDYSLTNCKVVYSPNIADLEVKKYPKIFFDKLEYEEKESILISQKAVKLSQNINLEPLIKPSAESTKEEKEKYKMKYDFYMATKYPTLIGAGYQKPNLICEYKTITRKKSKNLYEFPFGLDFVFEDDFNKKTESGLAFNLEFGYSLPNELDWESFEENQEKVIKEILNFEGFARFGGWEFGVQNFDKISCEQSAIHLLSFFDLTNLLDISNYGESMSFFCTPESLQNNNFEEVWLEMQCD